MFEDNKEIEKSFSDYSIFMHSDEITIKLPTISDNAFKILINFLTSPKSKMVKVPMVIGKYGTSEKKKRKVCTVL